MLIEVVKAVKSTLSSLTQSLKQLSGILFIKLGNLIFVNSFNFSNALLFSSKLVVSLKSNSVIFVFAKAQTSIFVTPFGTIYSPTQKGTLYKIVKLLFLSAFKIVLPSFSDL